MIAMLLEGKQERKNMNRNKLGKNVKVNSG